MGESRNKNSYNIGYFQEFQWQRRVLSESIGNEYFVLVLQATMANFYKTVVMPWVIGAVDGLVIPIRASHDQEYLYVCHKRFHAINTMTVCNLQLSSPTVSIRKKM